MRLVGAAPMQYLARWRMQVAATRLAGISDPVLAIGAHLGDGSSAALSRGIGEAPASYRRPLRYENGMNCVCGARHQRDNQMEPKPIFGPASATRRT